MEKTYVVYSEEYYFSVKALSTALRKNVYNVSPNKEDAEEVKYILESVLENMRNNAKVNANDELLTAYHVDLITLEGKYSINEAKDMVIDDDYTWGHVSKNR